jgi:hypothetical protein
MRDYWVLNMQHVAEKLLRSEWAAIYEDETCCIHPDIRDADISRLRVMQYVAAKRPAVNQLQSIKIATCCMLYTISYS